MPDEKNLWMHSIELDPRRLFATERTLRLPASAVDPGYLIHCQLAALFGDRAPRSFAIARQRHPELRILAYAGDSAEALHDHARHFADPKAYAAVDWSRHAAKPMPAEWAAGTRLGFEVRLCPVVRMAKSGPHYRRGAEVDVFLSKCWDEENRGKPVDRENVYRDWLVDWLSRRDGASLLALRMVRFQRCRFIRRTHEAQRVARVCERPDALVQGTLEITDALPFAKIIANGIGRHRAFGFGMLLLQPERRPC